MPPVNREVVERAECVINASLTSELLDQPPLSASEVFVPDDIRAMALYGVLAAIEDGTLNERELKETRSHLQMIHNLETFIHDREAGMDESQLFEHQKSVFRDTYSFLTSPPLEQNGTLGRKGYIKLPTGTGKTGIFTTLIDVLNKSPDPSMPKLKSLVLVPKLDLVDQTVGFSEDGNERGFAKFAKGTSVTEFHGKVKDLSGDAVVMTYRSFNKLVQANALDHDLFDLIVCDEAHNALGKQIKKSIQSYSEGKLLLGLTATPDYAENRRVSDLFPYEIHSMDLREAIEEGFLAPIQCFAVTSDEEIETISEFAREFTDEELEKLIENEWRNHKAVEFAKTFISQGKQGLVSCVPGQNIAHARLMAEKLESEFIVDPKTGLLRPIIAVAVGSDTTKDERRLIYESFERGEIDVLTYVDLLTEGWDSSAAKFMINLRPTTSPVSAVQRMGRILRPTEDGDIAIVVEFIDKSEKPQFTFYHALGIEEITLGKIYGKTESAPEEGNPGFDPATLPEELQELLRNVNHRLIGELVIQPEMYILPNGVVSINTFADMMGVGPKSIFNLIDELAIDADVYQFGTNGVEGFGLTVEQQLLIKQHEFFKIPVADETVKSIFAFGEQTGLGRTAIKNAAAALGLDLGIYRFDNNMAGHPALNEEQQRQVSEYIQALAPEANASVVSLNEFCRRNNTSRDMVQAVAEELGIELTTFNGKGRFFPGVTSEQAEVILNHPHYRTPELIDNCITLQALKSVFRMERLKLIEVMGELDMAPRLYRLGGRRILAITPEEFERLKTHVNLTMPTAPEGVMLLSRFSTASGVSMKVIEEIRAELGIELKNYRFVAKKGATVGPGVDAETTRRISEHPSFVRIIEATQNARQLGQRVARLSHLPADYPEGIKSMFSLSNELKISEQRLRDIVTELGIEVGEYRFARGKLGLGIHADKIAEIKQHPFFAIPATTDDDISINQASRSLRVDPSTLRENISGLGISTRLMRPPRGHPTDHITKDQLALLEQQPRFSVPVAPEGTKSLYALSKELGVSEKTLASLAGAQGISIGRYKVPRAKSYNVADCLTTEEQSILLEHPYFLIQQAPPDIRSVGMLCDELRAAQGTILRIVEQLEMPTTQYKFGSGKLSLGFTQQDVDKIGAALTAQRQKPRSSP